MTSAILVLLTITSNFRATSFTKSLQHRVVMEKKQTLGKVASSSSCLSVYVMRITDTLNVVRPRIMQDGLCPNAVDLT